MSVIIKGMEMPKSCYDCYFHEVYNYNGEENRVCEANWDININDEWGLDYKHPDCPLVEAPKWIPVTERLPENDVPVLLSCKCGAGAYVCDGFHTEKYSTPAQFYADIDADYDEETDEYYFPEGWWEIIKNWDDYSCVAIEDTVTHWMPLPEPPKDGES